MPGAQPRKDPLAKILSGVIRGTAAKAPGTAPVIRVPRGTARS